MNVYVFDYFGLKRYTLVRKTAKFAIVREAGRERKLALEPGSWHDGAYDTPEQAIAYRRLKLSARIENAQGQIDRDQVALAALLTTPIVEVSAE